MKTGFLAATEAELQTMIDLLDTNQYSDQTISVYLAWIEGDDDGIWEPASLIINDMRAYRLIVAGRKP